MRPEEKLANREFDLKKTYVDLDDLTPMLYAAKYGISGFISFCLSRCREEERASLLNVSSQTGLTALHYACLYGHMETAKLLTEFGASVLRTTSLQLLPIHMIFSDQNEINTCESLFNLFLNHQDVVDVISKKTSTNENLAHLAASKGALEILRRIKSIAPELLEARDNLSLTPLLRAVLHNHIEVVTYLLDNNEVNQKNSKGQNALHIGVISSSIEMVKALLPYFDSNIPDNENHSALTLAEISGQKNKQEVIINYNESRPKAGFSGK